MKGLTIFLKFHNCSKSECLTLEIIKVLQNLEEQQIDDVKADFFLLTAVVPLNIRVSDVMERHFSSMA